MIPRYSGRVIDQSTSRVLGLHSASMLALCASVLLLPVLVTLLTSAASGEVNLPVALIALGLGSACVRFPDSHLPLALVVALGVDWMVRVDTLTSPWSLAAAATLSAFHASTALSTAIPPGAKVPFSITRRWTARTLALVLASLVVWAAVVVANRFPLPGSSALLAVTLAALSIVTLAARPHGQ